MPVEDIDFLTKNSEKDSYLFFIDSSLRDKETFPTVSEYEIRFSEPFSNVYGLEVLDAMIPSTKYTIDKNRDVLKYHVALTNPARITDDSSWYQLLGSLYTMDTFRRLIDIPSPEKDGYYNMLSVVEKTSYVYTYVTEYTGYKLIEISKHPFLSGECRITTAESPLDTAIEIPYTFKGVMYGINKLFVTATGLETYISNHDIYIDMENTLIWVIDANNITVTTFHQLNQTTLGPGGTYVFPRSDILFTISNINEQLEHGNYDIFTFQTYLNSIIPRRHSYDIGGITYYFPWNDPGTSLPNVLQNTQYGNIERQSKYKFRLLTPNARFYMNLTETNIASAIGFSSKAPSKGDPLLFRVISEWPNADHYVVGTTYYKNEYIILSPGVINLNGLSYVILRCPEIESHMYNSFSYSKNCPGIGMFKLGALNQIINVRFDFVNFIKKPFHPIGKLPKITLRFESTNGDLYDFKGVDHNMLLSVKFYVPRLKDPEPKYVLNPNYNPNFLEYMINDMKIDDDENDDDAEWDTSLEDKRTILQRKYNRLIHEQNEYDYSSEEENDEFGLGDNETRVDDIMGRYRQ